MRAEFDSYPRSKYPKLFVSEYSSPRRLFPNSTTLGAAVAEAIYMAGMCAATLSLTLHLLGAEDLQPRPSVEATPADERPDALRSESGCGVTREANGDVVQLATYGDLMANSRDDHGSAGTSTILIDAARSFGSPSWVRNCSHLA